MQLSIYQVDAFTDKLFGGNPAAVVPLTDWLPSEVMQSIAAENNLSETAYFVKREGKYSIRWFTPVAEVDLCGHATLATAHIIWTEALHNGPKIIFQSKSGPLHVSKSNIGYTLDFPTDEIVKTDLPPIIRESFDAEILEVYRGKEDYLIRLTSEADVANLRPDFRKLANLSVRGVIATAPGNTVDIVSRCFFPYYGIDEDPVTGSAHTTLAPYWVPLLGKSDLQARQISQRGGELHVSLQGNRTLISGNAVTYLSGTISIE